MIKATIISNFLLNNLLTCNFNEKYDFYFVPYYVPQVPSISRHIVTQTHCLAAFYAPNIRQKTGKRKFDCAKSIRGFFFK